MEHRSVRQKNHIIPIHLKQPIWFLIIYLEQDILATSILHETIGYTDLTFKVIQTEFSPLVANQVVDLSRIKEGGNKISSVVMVKSLWLQKKYDLLLVKLFDRLQNIQTISVKSPEKIHKILEENISTFLVLAVYLNISNEEKKSFSYVLNI